MPGHLEGEGTHFEVTDSEYLNVTVDSTEPISIWLDSAPEIVSMVIEPIGAADTTLITISGLPPVTTLHKYQDGFDDHVVFTTDTSGVYGFEQDLSGPHDVFIQPTEGTKIIRDDATGGDCYLIGEWDPDTKTCTLTTDVYDTVWIANDGITLDGANHVITNFSGTGVLASGRSGITITGCRVQARYGINANYNSSSTFTGNSIYGLYVGSLGIYGLWASSCTFTGNVILWYRHGIYAPLASSCTFTGNLVHQCWTTGITASGASSCTFTGNTIQHSYRGMWLHHTDANSLFHNNFKWNTMQIDPPDGGPNTWYDPDLLEGNYWSDYPGADDGSGTGKHATADDCIGDTYLPWHGDEYPFKWADGWEYGCDPDGDGLTISEEYTLGTNPFDPDTDDDGVWDGTEVDMAEGGDCPDPLNADSDGDTLLDGEEIDSDPCNVDSDGDGLHDNIDPDPDDPVNTTGELEVAARTLCDLIRDLDLSLFNGPNDNANNGRRNALANRAGNAANDVADEDIDGAIDYLSSLLDKIDGTDPPPDWMDESEAKDVLAANAGALIVLLAME
jgi:parallel beta-helix repeat protein